MYAHYTHLVNRKIKMLERLKKIMREYLPQDAEDITPGMSLTNDIGLDSLERVELAVGIEAEFFDGDNVISDSESMEWKRVQEVLNYIEAKTAERAKA
jgi:acyl carrier protein